MWLAGLENSPWNLGFNAGQGLALALGSLGGEWLVLVVVLASCDNGVHGVCDGGLQAMAP